MRKTFLLYANSMRGNQLAHLRRLIPAHAIHYLKKMIVIHDTSKLSRLCLVSKAEQVAVRLNLL